MSKFAQRKITRDNVRYKTEREIKVVSDANEKSNRPPENYDRMTALYVIGKNRQTL